MNKSEYIQTILKQLKYPKELKLEISDEIESHLYQLDFGDYDYIKEFGDIDSVVKMFNDKKLKWKYLIGLGSTRKILKEFFATLLLITILIGTWFFWTWWFALMGFLFGFIVYVLIPVVIFILIVSLFYKKQLEINHCPKQILLSMFLILGSLGILPIAYFISIYTKSGFGFASIWPLLIYAIIIMIFLLINETFFN